MKTWLNMGAVCLTAAAVGAVEPMVISLWPEGKVPLLKNPVPERADVGKDKIIRITNVASPTLTVYALAKGSEPAPAVLVCPGGGYSILAWNLEGTEIAEWLNRNGFSAFILKYRVPDNQRDAALCDAQRAMGLIRSRAEMFGINPKRLGIIGFSAGAHLAVRTCTTGNKRFYTPLDAADALPSRPDFAMIIYPAYLNQPGTGELSPELTVTRYTPPTFLAQAENDSPYVDSSLAYFKALKAAGVKAELHIFPTGGHGFGIRQHRQASDAWGNLAGVWLKQFSK